MKKFFLMVGLVILTSFGVGGFSLAGTGQCTLYGNPFGTGGDICGCVYNIDPSEEVFPGGSYGGWVAAWTDDKKNIVEGYVNVDTSPLSYEGTAILNRGALIYPHSRQAWHGGYYDAVENFSAPTVEECPDNSFSDVVDSGTSTPSISDEVSLMFLQIVIFGLAFWLGLKIWPKPRALKN